MFGKNHPPCFTWLVVRTLRLRLLFYAVDSGFPSVVQSVVLCWRVHVPLALSSSCGLFHETSYIFVEWQWKSFLEMLKTWIYFKSLKLLFVGMLNNYRQMLAYCIVLIRQRAFKLFKLFQLGVLYKFQYFPCILE